MLSDLPGVCRATAAVAGQSDSKTFCLWRENIAAASSSSVSHPPAGSGNGWAITYMIQRSTVQLQCSEVPLNKFEDEFEVKVKSAVDS
jgi:hypothetical protein